MDVQDEDELVKMENAAGREQLLARTSSSTSSTGYFIDIPVHNVALGMFHEGRENFF